MPFLVTDQGLWHRVGQPVGDAGLARAATARRAASPTSASASPSSSSPAHAPTSSMPATRRLTGRTPLPPKAAFGLIQCKARYESQEELLDVAEGYRAPRLSARRDGARLVLLDADGPARHRSDRLPRSRRDEPPAPRAGDAHDRLASGRASRRKAAISTRSPRRGWLLHDKDGKPVDGLAVRSDRAGALLDATNPEARAWYLGQGPRQYRRARASTGSGSTRPSPIWSPTAISTRSARATAITTSTRCCTPASVADGSARDRPDFRNMILCRAAYLGAQANGCLFWSSDVHATWEALRRQVPTGLNMTASGIAYWSSDTGGWQWPQRSEGAASAADRSRRGDRDGAGLYRLSRAVRPLVRVQRLHADAAHPWQPPGDRDLAIWQSGRADPRAVAAAALPR